MAGQPSNAKSAETPCGFPCACCVLCKEIAPQDQPGARKEEAMAGQGLLVALNDVDAAVEDDFNAWQEGEYLPQLVRGVPGFVGTQRYRVLQGEPKYLALCDLEDVEVVERPEFQAARPSSPTATPLARQMEAHYRAGMRGVYETILALPGPQPSSLASVRALLAVGVDIPPAREEEFQEWYTTEHLRRLSQVPGVLRARFNRLYLPTSEMAGTPPLYISFYELSDPGVRGNDDWKRASSTSWTERMRRIFVRRISSVYERVYWES